MYSFGGFILIMEILIFCFIAAFLIRSLVRNNDRQKETTSPVQSEMFLMPAVLDQTDHPSRKSHDSGNDHHHHNGHATNHNHDSTSSHHASHDSSSSSGGTDAGSSGSDSGSSGSFD